MCLYISAKMAHSVCGDQRSERLLMYKRNKSGPSIEPCGTPDVIGSHSEQPSSHNVMLILVFG